MENKDKSPGDTKWNNEQTRSRERNEGFSGENIPENYDPSQTKKQAQLQSESETDKQGNEKEVQRARNMDRENPDVVDNDVDNSIIENKRSLENRDHNYDTDAARFKSSHTENRGNMELDKD